MREFVYLNRANTITRRLLDSGEPLTVQQQQAILRAQIHIGGHCIDTEELGDPIQYEDGKVLAQLGLIEGLQPGQYTARITAFDAVKTEGVAWGQFEVTVLPWECGGE